MLLPYLFPYSALTSTDIATETIEQIAPRPTHQGKLEQTSGNQGQQNSQKGLPEDQLALSHTSGGSQNNHIPRYGNRYTNRFREHEDKNGRQAILDEKNLDAIHDCLSLHTYLVQLPDYQGLRKNLIERLLLPRT